MNERNDKWLDEQLKMVVDSGKVEFDSAQWKRKYSAEYETLVSRAGNRPNVLRFLRARLLLKVAAIITIAATVIFLTVDRTDKSSEQPAVTTPERSPAVMLSRLSLMRAYNRGGMEAMDEQCRKAFEMLGKSKPKISMQELLNDDNGV